MLPNCSSDISAFFYFIISSYLKVWSIRKILSGACESRTAFATPSTAWVHYRSVSEADAARRSRRSASTDARAAGETRAWSSAAASSKGGYKLNCTQLENFCKMFASLPNFKRPMISKNWLARRHLDTDIFSFSSFFIY